MAKILIAWEFGRGLGHVANFGALASELVARGNQVSVAANDLAVVSKYLPKQVQIYASPVMPAVALNGVPRTYAELLLGLGYANAENLATFLRAWRSLLNTIGAGTLIADHAPTALLAAQDFGIKKVNIGIGFCCPPNTLATPIFRTWDAAPDAQMLGQTALADQFLLQNINAARASLALPALADLQACFNVDQTYICSFLEFDHYPNRQANVATTHVGPALMLDAGDTPTWPQAHSQVNNPKVFAYLKANHMDWQGLVKALRQARVNALVYLQGAVVENLREYAGGNVKIVQAPVNMRQCLLEAKAVICAGGVSTVCAALLSGKPVMVVPQFAEQYLTGLNLQKIGAGVVVIPVRERHKYKEAVQALVSSDPIYGAAQAFSKRYAGFSFASSVQQMTDYCAEPEPNIDVPLPQSRDVTLACKDLKFFNSFMPN